MKSTISYGFDPVLVAFGPDAAIINLLKKLFFRGANEMENHRLLSLPMKTLLEFVITNSVQFCQDMRMDMTEEELEEMSVKDFRNQILDNATVFFAQELEPDGNADVPPYIVTCIKERVGELSIGQLIGLLPLSLR